ncbi:MAG TPA: hypothetical protein VEZ44_01235 [bacterium]|nr:hypothetical protein [bacterium]
MSGNSVFLPRGSVLCDQVAEVQPLIQRIASPGLRSPRVTSVRRRGGTRLTLREAG